jgi:hypothetical protein
VVSEQDASSAGAETIAAAIDLARTALGRDAGEPARGWVVHGVPSTESDFVLVVFGAPAHAVAIAAVATSSGEVIESARLPGSDAHEPMPADEARRRAAMPPDTRARLVWSPSPASRSRFYPLWEITRADHTIWVDSVRGTVVPSLDDGRRGG